MTGASYWRPIWLAKAAESIESASGRSNYDEATTAALVEDARRALGIEPWDALLDIGCAKGLMGERLAQMVDRYVGVDYSAAAVDDFRRRCGVDARAASAVALPFSDREFSKTLMSSVLLCLDRKECIASIQEMRRVTKRAGRGFISGNLDSSRIGACALKSSYEAASWFWPDELMRLAIECGWTDARIVYPDARLPQAPYMFDMIVYA